MQRQNSTAVPSFILDALKSLKPFANKTVSEWADSTRILGSTSSAPGKWRTSFTPYLKSIMDSFNDPGVEEIIVVKPTQVGGTEVILNMIGYIIDVDPSPMTIVYPTELLAESISANRIQPMINLASSLKEKYDQNSKRLELQFENMYIAIVGANSPSGLSSRPCRYVFMDETDKYPSNSGKEADPISLAKERTKTFDIDKKIVQMSTPTLDTGPIWQAYLAADVQYEYFVRCPHCESQWTFKFKQLKFDSTSPDMAMNSAFYVCEECGSQITDKDKITMVKNGEWKSIKGTSGRTVAFHFNTFCSPWVRLGDIAKEFVKSKDSNDKLMNFINSWLAEPYVQVESSVSAEGILKNNMRVYQKHEVPKGTVLITGGVDVQRKCFYYTIRAWRSNMTSFNIAHGKVYTWQEIEDVYNKSYYDKTGKEYIVNLTCVDSGDQTDDVYDFCAINREWTMAIKGSSGRMNSRYKINRINKDGIANGIQLCIVDTDTYKSSIHDRIFRNEDNGGWYVYDNCDPEYAEMIASEHKVIEKSRGKLITKWKVKQSGGDNHYFDCEVYAAVAADLAGIRAIMENRYRKKEVQQVEEIPANNLVQQTSGGIFAGSKGGYFK